LRLLHVHDGGAEGTFPLRALLRDVPEHLEDWEVTMVSR
jgi:hypothetical protein